MGSGRASTSLSWTREKPSMADPSKVMPSSRAFSSSAGVMAKVLAVPRTSVNHSWTNRTARSSTVLSTYSCWLRMSPPLCVTRCRPAAPAGRGRPRPPVSQAREGLGDEFIRRLQTGNGREIPPWKAERPADRARWAGAAARTCESAGQPPPWCRREGPGRRRSRVGEDRPRRNRGEADPGGSAPLGEGRGHRDRRRPVRRPARPHAALLGSRPRSSPRTSSRRASGSTAPRSGGSRRSRSRTCCSCPTPTRRSSTPSASTGR